LRIPRSKSSDSRQVVVVDEYGRVIGLAESSGDSYIVTKVFREKKPPVETRRRTVDLSEVVKHNVEGIE